MPPISTSAGPLYRGIVDDIHSRIRSGQLPPGSQIPTIEDLCDCYKVSAITAKRAVADLQALGAVRSVRGKGTFVTQTKDTAGGTDMEPTPLRSILLLVSFSTRPDKQSSFFGAIWDAVVKTADAHGLRFRVETVPEGGSNFHVDFSLDPDPSEGLIFATAIYPYRIMHMVHDRRLSAVTVDAASFLADAVLTDNLHGMKLLIDHLAGMGHRRLLLATQYPTSPNTTNENERAAAFRFLCEDRGLHGEEIPADNHDAIFRRLRGRQAPTAVMFLQDAPARLFMKRAAAIGVRVPHDVSVTGFDGWSAHGDDSTLTTMRVDREGLGRSAVELLIRESRQPRVIRQWLRVPGRLVEGQTAARPRR